MDFKDYAKLQNKNEKNFWYEARKILLSNLLDKVFVNHDNKINILDIGCGTGTELSVLSKYGQVTALDSNPEALIIAKSLGYNVLNINIEKNDLPEKKYDCVCCFDVLEHLQRDNAVIQKIFKTLKDRGSFVFTVPAFQFLFSPHDQALEHFRRYNKFELKTMLENNGFKIITMNYWNVIFFPAILIIRLTKKIFFAFNKRDTFSTEMKNPNRILNKFLFQILNIENKICAKNIKFPFGLTIYGIAQKNNALNQRRLPENCHFKITKSHFL